MVHRKAAYRPLGMQGASGLRDTPGHTSRSLQRTNVYKVDRVKIDKKMNTGHNDFGGSSSSGCILHLCQIFKASELNNASHVKWDPFWGNQTRQQMWLVILRDFQCMKFGLVSYFMTPASIFRHLSSVQNPGWLVYIRHYNTQLYLDYFINHEIRIPFFNQPV